ncbi:hypothetical protein AVEN_16899-1, partial [Araneus ventricosus]
MMRHRQSRGQRKATNTFRGPWKDVKNVRAGRRVNTARDKWKDVNGQWRRQRTAEKTVNTYPTAERRSTRPWTVEVTSTRSWIWKETSNTFVDSTLPRLVLCGKMRETLSVDSGKTSTRL